jgi:hypothetical protein
VLREHDDDGDHADCSATASFFFGIDTLCTISIDWGSCYSFYDWGSLYIYIYILRNKH